MSAVWWNRRKLPRCANPIKNILRSSSKLILLPVVLLNFGQTRRWLRMVSSMSYSTSTCSTSSISSSTSVLPLLILVNWRRRTRHTHTEHRRISFVPYMTSRLLRRFAYGRVHGFYSSSRVYGLHSSFELAAKQAAEAEPNLILETAGTKFRARQTPGKLLDANWAYVPSIMPGYGRKSFHKPQTDNKLNSVGGCKRKTEIMVPHPVVVWHRIGSRGIMLPGMFLYYGVVEWSSDEALQQKTRNSK